MLKWGLYYRGAFCVVIGILYLVVARLYWCYYKNNTLTNKYNEHLQLLYGPNNLIYFSILVNSMFFFMFLFLAFAYFRSATADVEIEEMVSKACGAKWIDFSDIIEKAMAQLKDLYSEAKAKIKAS